MAKETIKTNKKTNQAYLVLIAISFLSILIGGSYQNVWGKDYQGAIEVAEWVPPLPTPSVEQDNSAKAIKPDNELDNGPDNELEDVVEPTKELAPMPTQAVTITFQPSITPSPTPSIIPSITPVITPQTTGRGKVVPVNMSQLFVIVVVGMTSLKLILVVTKQSS